MPLEKRECLAQPPSGVGMLGSAEEGDWAFESNRGCHMVLLASLSFFEKRVKYDRPDMDGHSFGTIALPAKSPAVYGE
jgi:hypothetical protein